ncbi:MAG: pentapeptide repeat-containing protein, partial [Streptomyces sp.]|nr:pentapeptide repeat-containing protein [Streptomyces sp.]
LVGADLRGADLRSADLIGADVRGADLRAADLRGALFVTASQLGAASGDPETRLPRGLDRPAHWV